MGAFERVAMRPEFNRFFNVNVEEHISPDELTMYLTESDGVALLRRIVNAFPTGELQFDAFNRLGIKSQWMKAVVRRSGSALYWAINGPDDIVGAVPRARLLAWESPFDSASFQGPAWFYRVMAGVMSAAPALRYMPPYHRYAF